MRSTFISRVKPSARRIIAVGGGKGGIGKSLVSSNLAIELARRGKRVVLVDADLGGANLHTCLGMDLPARSLSEFIDHRIEDLKDAVTPTGIPNLGLISGALDRLDAANPNHQQKMRLLRHLRGLDADYAMLDLGAGTHFNVLDFFLVADHGILVMIPEPTSVENGYRFLKAAFWRRMRAAMTIYGYEDLIQMLAASGTRTPAELLEAIKAENAEAGADLAREMVAFRPRLVLNQVRTAEDAQVAQGITGAWRRFFGLDMDCLGNIAYDDAIWRAVRARRPLLLESPDSPAAASFARLADSLIAIEASDQAAITEGDPS